MNIRQELHIENKEERVVTDNPPEKELKDILYDEALKVAGNHDDAKALAEEAFNDFLAHHALTT